MLVCQAGTSLIQPQSKRTVPPRFGSWTFSTPCSSSQLAISTIATHSAPVRVATPTASAMWSACPWEIATWVGSTSSALATAAGLLGLRNGSTRTLVSPSLSSKHEWPWNLISIFSALLRVRRFGHLLMECPADGDSNHHPHPRLLGEQRAHGGDPLLGIGHRRRLQRLGLVGLAEPAALGERRGEHLLQLRRGAGDDLLGLGEALGVDQPLDRGVQLLVRGHDGGA